MDTPGGLDTSMRSIIKDILASPMPVAVRRAEGARAASAGTYILYAATSPRWRRPPTSARRRRWRSAWLARRQPGTGQASQRRSAPETGRDTLDAKRINDAAAYIRSLAQLRGRDADWAERAVREAVSLRASEALARR